MSQSNALRPIVVPASRAASPAPWTSSLWRAWKLALEIARESRAMEKKAWNSNRLPSNGW